MYIYLNKKIAIPKGVKLSVVNWNHTEGWLACGGEQGLLKILKLDSLSSESNNIRGIASSFELSMNQTLDEHSSLVTNIAWNEPYSRLTSIDDQGLIVIWTLHKKTWIKDMINPGSPDVSCLSWKSDGKFVAICYTDGKYMIGTITGSKKAGKNIGFPISHVCWDPSDSHLLFLSKQQNRARLYSIQGQQLQEMDLAFQKEEAGEIVCVEWYDQLEGLIAPGAPSLAIAWKHGHLQLCRGTNDPRPVVMNTGLEISTISWSANGHYLAVAGVDLSTKKSCVHLFSPYGERLTTLRLALTTPIKSISWDGTSLRLALAVGSSVFLANVRPDRHWACFSAGKSIGYAFRRPERQDDILVFWHWSRSVGASTSRHVRYVQNLHGLVSSVDSAFCVGIARVHSKAEEVSLLDRAARSSNPRAHAYISRINWDEHQLILMNPMGASITTEMVPFEPTVSSAGSEVFVCVEGGRVCVWYFGTNDTTWMDHRGEIGKDENVPNLMSSDSQKILEQETGITTGSSSGSTSFPSSAARSSEKGGSSMAEESRPYYKMWHVDTNPVASYVHQVMNLPEDKADPLTAACASKARYVSSSSGVQLSVTTVVVARKSGKAYAFEVAVERNSTKQNMCVSQVGRFSVSPNPQKAYLSCDASHLGIIDSSHTLRFWSSKLADPSRDRTGHEIQKPRRSVTINPEVLERQLKEESEDIFRDIKQHHYEFSALDFVRNEVWELRFASDLPTIFAYMEKQKFVFVRDFQAEEPIIASCYLGRLAELRVDAVMLDQIMQDPLHPASSLVVPLESHAIKTVQQMINEHGISQAYSLMVAQPDLNYPVLANTIAEAALSQSSLKLAHKAFARSKNYAGMQLVKKLTAISDETRSQAETLVHFGKFAEAENLYLKELDRPDLVIQLRKTLGDWSRVLQLATDTSSGSSVDDALVKQAQRGCAMYYRDHGKLLEAASFFKKANSTVEYAEILMQLEAHKSLSELVDTIPATEIDLLTQIASMLKRIGCIEAACRTLVKANRPEQALQVAVDFNEWELASDLSSKLLDSTAIAPVLQEYAIQLIENGAFQSAISLLLRSQAFSETAEILALIAISWAHATCDSEVALETELKAAVQRSETSGSVGFKATGGNGRGLDKETIMNSPHLRRASSLTATKKVLILAAKQYSLYCKKASDSSFGASSTLDALIAADVMGGVSNTRKSTFSDYWTLVHTIHLLIAAVSNIYRGDYIAALATAQRLRDQISRITNDDFIPVPLTTIYAVYVLAAICARQFSIADVGLSWMEIHGRGSTAENVGTAEKDIGLSSILQFIPHSLDDLEGPLVFHEGVSPFAITIPKKETEDSMVSPRSDGEERVPQNVTRSLSEMETILGIPETSDITRIAMEVTKLAAKESNEKALQHNCPVCGKEKSILDCQCPHCSVELPYCSLSGYPLEHQAARVCGVCKAYFDPERIQGRTSCPVCHAALSDNSD